MGSCLHIAGVVTVLQSCRSERLNECPVSEGFLQGRVAMAGLLHFLLLVSLHFGSFSLILARPDHETTTMSAAFTATRSIFSAGSTNSTEAPGTGVTAGGSQTTTKPPKSNKTTERLNGDTGKTADRTVSRTEEEGGPVELGEYMLLFVCFFSPMQTLSLNLCPGSQI